VRSRSAGSISCGPDRLSESAGPPAWARIAALVALLGLLVTALASAAASGSLAGGLPGLGAVLSSLVALGAEQGLIGNGILYTVSRYDQSLALAGLGCAVALAPRRWPLVAAFAFAGAIAFGGLAESHVAEAIAAEPALIDYLALIGPISCVTAGLALALPSGMGRWLLPLAAAGPGMGLGLVIVLDETSVEYWQFAAGVVFAGIALAAAPAVLLSGLRAPWVTVASRILGGWLIAIGLMLGGAKLIAKPTHETAAASAAASWALRKPRSDFAEAEDA
jgi:hypothetical protein